MEIVYDTAGRPASLSILRGTTSFAYDTAGRLSTLTAPDGGTMSYSYFGTLPNTIGWSGPVTASITFGYDTNLRVTSESVSCASSSLPPCQSVGFGYDNDGLPVGAGSMQLTWDPGKPLLTGTAADLIGQSMTYNQHGELLTLAANAAGQPFFTEELTRDAGGRITTRTETIEGVANTYTYGYDPAGRLSSVSANGTTSASYTYDPNGNRLTRTTAAGTENGSYDDQDRVASYGGATYTFNGAGDLTSVATSTGTTNTTYDELGNLTAVHLPNGDQIEYVIDAQNRRIGKKRNGTLERRWVWRDGLRIAAELDSSGNVVSRFVYGTGGNAPDLMIRNDETYELVKDHLGSVRVVIGTSDGAIVQRLDYDEYGNVTNDTAPGFQPFGFAGGVYDPDTKLVRFGERDYDSRVGRWTTKDPLLFKADDPNLYAYVESDPVNFSDSSGLAKGGKQNITTEGFTRLSDPKAVEAAMEAAKLAGQVKRFKALRALLKVIKRGGTMCFVFGAALEVFGEIELWTRAIENDRTVDQEFRHEVGSSLPYI